MGCCGASKLNRIKIVICGLSKSGKTVIFFKLTDHPDFTNPIPTIGYNSQIVTCRNKNVTIVDIGTPQSQKNSLSYLLASTNGFIFVVDSIEKARLEESRRLFQNYLKDKSSPTCPILIFFNNKDNSVVQLSDLERIFKLGKTGRKIKILICNGVTGIGIQQGLDWILDRIQRGD